MDLAEEEEAAMAAVITEVATAAAAAAITEVATAAAATAAAITEVATAAVAMAAVITAAATAAVAITAAITEVATAAAMAAVILNLILPLTINLLERKVGRIEVTETLLKTLNMKAVGAGEEGEFLMIAMVQIRKISNPFLLN